MIPVHPYQEVISEDSQKQSIELVLECHKKSNEEKDGEGRKSVFADTVQTNFSHPIKLEVLAFKVPIPATINNRPLHPKINRFLLPHSLSDGRSSVLLVTKDLKKKTVALNNAHHLEMLTNADCNHLVSEIMTLKQLKDEYSEAEARDDLCSRTDFVLCEKPLVNIVPRLLGRPFNKAKKYPVAVDLKQSNLKKHLNKLLSFTDHKMTFRNTQSSMTFGRSLHSKEQLTENMHAALQYLCSDKFPGGWPNVKSLYITIGLKTRVPFYISTGTSSDVPSLVVEKVKAEVLEGDFGFGHVRITETGDILEYTPHPEDEEAQFVQEILQKKRKLSKAKSPTPKKMKLSSAKSPTPKKMKQQDNSTKKKKFTKKSGAAKKIDPIDSEPIRKVSDIIDATMGSKRQRGKTSKTKKPAAAKEETTPKKNTQKISSNVAGGIKKLGKKVVKKSK